MLSETLAEGLENYRIGPKLRTLRLKKKMGLVELGKHTGLSPGMLSKIERGLLYPTLPTLLRVSLVFGVGLDHFFLEARERPVTHVVRASDRLRLPDQPEPLEPAYRFECLDFPATDRPMSSFFVEFLPGVASQPHHHDGFEMLYVVDGKLGVTIDDEERVLDRGDSIYFDSTQQHSYRKVAGRKCSAVVVTTE